MTKPHRNNSPSYEDWLVSCMKRAVLSGGEVNEHESLLGDLQEGKGISFLASPQNDSERKLKQRSEFHSK